MRKLKFLTGYETFDPIYFFTSRQNQSFDGIMRNFGFVENLNKNLEVGKIHKKAFFIFYKTKIAHLNDLS